MTTVGSLSRNSRSILCVVVLVLINGALSNTVAVRGAEAAVSVYVPSSVIDRPAVDRVVPADAAVNVKTQFGAKGDGLTDDTVPIQTAISAALGAGNPHSNVYFPSGTYIISQPLVWKLPNGTWSTGASLIGQNRDQTILRLKSGAPGFGNAAAPMSMIVTASQNAAADDGGGNQAFNNFIFDLTIDVGNNIGANGVDLVANNRGAIRNVVITAPPGTGNVGLLMTRKWPGPVMIEDVAIRGFARGVLAAAFQYGVTLENLRLFGQRVAGIDNTNNILSIRRLVSNNSVPAILNGGSLDLVDSNLFGGAAGTSAVTNQSTAFLRRVGLSGYTTLINDRGSPKNLPTNGEYSSSTPLSLTGTNHSLALAVPETPVVPNYAAIQWAGLGAASTTDAVDDTTALQNALNSGRPVVYLRPTRVVLSQTLDVPATVRAIVGFGCTVDATTGVFAGTTSPPVFRVHGAVNGNIEISNVVFNALQGVVDVENAGTGSVALTDIHTSGSPVRGGITWYLDDIEGGSTTSTWNFTSGQHIYARQFNPEQTVTKVVNNGATLWVLGIKTERAGTVVESSNGASTEILGGLIYPAMAVPAGVPGFLSVDSKQSLSFTIGADSAASRYDPLISTTIAGRSASLSPPVQPGGFGSRVPLYADGY